MVSVTSEALASRSFQGATPRSARPDPASRAGNDGFASLVDSNTAPTSDNNRYDPQPAPARRSDDSTSTTDPRSRDTSTAPDRAPRDSGSSRDDNKVDSDSDAPRKTKSKSKSDDSKSSTDTQSTGDKATTQAVPQPDPSNAAAANAVVAVPVATAAATDPTATPPSGQPAAPLAIAAAAIAASSAIAGTAAAAGSGAPAGADTATAATTAANADKVAKAAGVKTEGQVITTDAATVSGAATATGDATLAATVAAGTAATKATTQAKAQVAAKDTTATTPTGQDDATQGSNAAVQATPTNIVPAATQPAAVSGKAKATADGAADAIKADTGGDGNAAPTPPVGGHAAAQAQLTTPDPGAQAPNALQTQLPASQTTPSATAQLTVTSAAQAAVPVSGLAMQIAASAKSGKSRFEIRLDPAELGRIDVRIDVDRNGQVTSHLTVERPETLSMLRQDANQLQRALDNAGLSTGNGGLQFSLRDQSQSGQNNNGQSNPNAHRLIVTEEDSVPAAAAGRSYGRPTGALGGVDIRV